MAAFGSWDTETLCAWILREVQLAPQEVGQLVEHWRSEGVTGASFVLDMSDTEWREMVPRLALRLPVKRLIVGMLFPSARPEEEAPLEEEPLQVVEMDEEPVKNEEPVKTEVPVKTDVRCELLTDEEEYERKPAWTELKSVAGEPRKRALDTSPEPSLAGLIKAADLEAPPDPKRHAAAEVSPAAGEGTPLDPGMLFAAVVPVVSTLGLTPPGIAADDVLPPVNTVPPGVPPPGVPPHAAAPGAMRVLRARKASPFPVVTPRRAAAPISHDDSGRLVRMCRECHVEKSILDFHKDKKGLGGFKADCSACCREKRRRGQ